ncbi:MAG TPA: glycosyltransferase family 39 protein, partial [Tepidisphaeraceae bacterium]|nr:glycosyltransferase family 39 protein [Tepidisphaeraceae bacterium]
MRNRFKISLIVLAALGVYLAGNGRVSLWDRDEPRYAQTSRQMLQSGDWVVPRLLDLVRNAKPIFIYWCQASAMKVFGDNEFAARLPSSLAMVLTLMVMGGVVYRMIGARRAMWTTFILATTVL